MRAWNYLHRIEYRREVSKSQCVHVYTEVVEDMGWCFSHKEERREGWLAYYTTVCAEEFLVRSGASPGTYFITVYQKWPDRLVHVCTVRLSFQGGVAVGSVADGKPWGWVDRPKG